MSQRLKGQRITLCISRRVGNPPGAGAEVVLGAGGLAGVGVAAVLHAIQWVIMPVHVHMCLDTNKLVRWVPITRPPRANSHPWKTPTINLNEDTLIL